MTLNSNLKIIQNWLFITISEFAAHFITRISVWEGICLQKTELPLQKYLLFIGLSYGIYHQQQHC